MLTLASRSGPAQPTDNAMLIAFTSAPYDAIAADTVARLTPPRLRALARMTRQRRVIPPIYRPAALTLAVLAQRGTPPAAMAARTGLTHAACSTFLEAFTQ